MNLKAKLYEQHHKEIAQQKLAARIAMLETKETGRKPIDKDTLIKKLKAEIRRVDRRLRQVALNERLTAENLKHKEEKAAAEKLARQAAIGAPNKKKVKGPRKEKKPRIKSGGGEE